MENAITSTALTVIDDFENCNMSFSSFAPKSKEEKIAMYNAVNSPDHQIADMKGKQLEIADLIVEKVQMIDQATGVLKDNPRIVVLDPNGESYSCVSFGVLNSMKKLIAVFGEPSWKDDPIKVEVVEVKTAKGKTMTLKAL